MKSEVDMYVIRRIKEKRKELGISQRTLSELLNHSLGYVGQVETPHCPAKYSAHDIFLIAKEFNCAAGEFFPPLDFTPSE
ncbi:helix-turn-helix domain-containing protein [Alistipes sp.]|uniref:helix-turn-helix domain-containing protein n=1 Tax=Alistipes sp. TaxID=1872444 RepID=UPI003AB3E7C9